MERIPFNIIEEIEHDSDLERLRSLSNTELLDFINEASEHIGEVEGYIELSILTLQERGFDVKFLDKEE